VWDPRLADVRERLETALVGWQRSVNDPALASSLSV
jgi:hypothetical protein